jgi:hypothetical protein
MPLVSGVCRTASAPMLSHGGSRLNASKPEANPKTRYPTHTSSQHPVFRRGGLGSCKHFTNCFLNVDIPKGLHVVMTNQIRHSSQDLCCFREFSLTGFSIESPHKPLPPARPRWRQVSHIITSKFLITQQTQVVLFTLQQRPVQVACLTPDLHPKAAKAQHNLFQTQRPPPNERTCIGWHKRYASVSGRSSRGIYVPRR